MVKEAIAGMVQDHLRDQRATEFFEFQLYPEALDAVLRDVAEEVIVEGFEEQLLTQVCCWGWAFESGNTSRLRNTP